MPPIYCSAFLDSPGKTDGANPEMLCVFGLKFCSLLQILHLYLRGQEQVPRTGRHRSCWSFAGAFQKNLEVSM